MKRVLGLAAAIAVLGFANAASAAGTAVPSYDWTGFYLGGYYGAAIGEQQGSTPLGTTIPGSHGGQTTLNSTGVTVGLTAGYNWQFDPHWLVGLEGDLGWLGINKSQIEFNDNTNVGLKTDWYGTARLRFGYVTGPSLLYVTGGGAFVHLRDEFGGTIATVGSTLASSTSVSWTAGAGIETMVSHNWSAKTEYLYIARGNTVSFIANPDGAPGIPSAFEQDFHVIKTGLNYHFGGRNDEGLFDFITAPPQCRRIMTGMASTRA